MNVIGEKFVRCPGLTHPTGSVMEEVDGEEPVQLTAEGKEGACAVGLTAMSTADIKNATSGIGVHSMHSLGDGLWKDYKVEV